ncbi:MAG: helix-turn-helix domain-containing protein [Ruthenibacterium sp.]
MSEPGVQSVARAFHILEALARAKRPVALQELSAALGLSKSTVHRLLACLVDLGYAEHLPGGLPPGAKAGRPGARPAPAARDHCALCRPAWP